MATVPLRDAALATSANTISVVRYGRAVRGHIMNPVTGWPAHALLQASVVARSAVVADALSTAMVVSGRPPREGGVLRVVTARTADGTARGPAPGRARAPGPA